MKRINILLGAGASYGAGAILPERPPLGNQLFIELQRIYSRSWGTIDGELKAKFLSNFELGMKFLWDNFSHFVAPLMQDMSEYFIQFRPVNNASLYCKLVQALKESNKLNSVSFTSLNYDILLELSLINNGIKVNYFDPDLDEPDVVEVLKIHGSSNFVGTGIQGGKGISYGSGVTFNGGIEATLDRNVIIENNLVKSGIGPVMSLYMEGKPVNVSPQIIQDIQKTYHKRCENSAITIVVGVKPLEADRHIWDSIINSLGDLYYVGADSDFAYFRKAGRFAVHLGEYFNLTYNKILNTIYETN